MKRKPNGYWTYERCKDAALKCEYRSEMEKKSYIAYQKILKKGWLDLFSHMKRLGNRCNRLVYVYEFDDNHCYIGLTGNIERRNGDHIKRDKDSSVYKYLVNNSNYKLVKISDYIDVENAILLEEQTLIKYKNNGWTILNIAKTGSVGLNDIKWNKDTCRKEASKYNRIVDFMKKSGRAYYISVKNNWIDEFFPTREICKRGYWNNKELCKEEAKKYKNRFDFRINSWSAYNYSKINKWLDEFYPE